MQAITLQAAGVSRLAAAVPARRPARAARKLHRVLAQTETGADVVDENIGEYCTLGADGKRPVKELTLADKEQMFLEAMMAYYFDQQPFMSNEDFDNLKDELTWAGSRVVVLSSDEQKFLEARLAYNKGRTIMSDTEYDALKERLRGSSVFAPAEGPSCSLGNAPGQRGQKSGAAAVDYLKLGALNLIPTLAVAGAVVSLDLLTGSNLIKLPGTVGVVVWGLLVLPAVYTISYAIRNFIFTSPLILKAACPNCGEENITYFGDILTVPGNREKNTVKCPCCESQLTFDANSRTVTVTELAKA